MINVSDTDALFERINWNDTGLVPAIIQDNDTKQVLMMAWMNRESLRLTLETGETIFWSRSRGKLWHKGETSGNVQRVIDFRIDCDADVLLFLVEPAGAACHTGETTCFFRNADEFSTTDMPYV